MVFVMAGTLEWKKTNTMFENSPGKCFGLLIVRAHVVSILKTKCDENYIISNTVTKTETDET